MRAPAHRILLLVLFGVWIAIAWPGLSRQFATLEYWKQRLGDRPAAERAAMMDYPAYVVAEQVTRATPPDACVVFLAYTGPEHVNYYKTRFDYYLYPRRVRIYADTGAAPEGCPWVAVFRDAPRNLAEEPFRGSWNDDQLRQRLAAMEKVASGLHVEIYRPRR